MSNRKLAWFSCGAASAVSTKLALSMYDNVEIVRIHIKDEDIDNDRFANECEQWFGQEIKVLTNDEFQGSVDKVIEKRRYMSGVAGAPCTSELKKAVRKNYQRFDDSHIFGFDVNEKHRVDQVLDAEPELDILTPLIEHEIDKDFCFQLIRSVGIEIPRMYRLGFPNANCIGCVKASGAGYWSNVRKHFPDVFYKRCEQERLIGAKLWKISVKKYQKLFPEKWDKMNNEEPDCYVVDKRGQMRLPLRWLPEGYALDKIEPMEDCGILCELKE